MLLTRLRSQRTEGSLSRPDSQDHLLVKLDVFANDRKQDPLARAARSDPIEKIFPITNRLSIDGDDDVVAP